MKRIIQTIKRNRIFTAIKERCEAERKDQIKINYHDDISDLSESERKSMMSFINFQLIDHDVIRSHFNLEHWRKVKQARIQIK